MENNAEFLGKLIESYAVLFHQNPNSHVFVSLADSYLKLGNKERALWICREGLKTHPEYTAGLALMGKICYATSDLESAERFCLHALKKAPENLMAHKILQQIYWERGECQKALESLRVLSGQSPHSTLYRERLKAASGALSRPFNGNTPGDKTIRNTDEGQFVRLVDYLKGDPLSEGTGGKSRVGLFSPGHPASSIELPDKEEDRSDPPEETVSAPIPRDRAEDKTAPAKDPGAVSFEGPGPDLEEELENPLGVVLKITADWSYLREEEPDFGEEEADAPPPTETEADKKGKSFFGLRNIFNLF